jgi:hypothetical protein
MHFQGAKYILDAEENRRDMTRRKETGIDLQDARLQPIRRTAQNT